MYFLFIYIFRFLDKFHCFGTRGSEMSSSVTGVGESGGGNKPRESSTKDHHCHNCNRREHLALQPPWLSQRSQRISIKVKAPHSTSDSGLVTTGSRDSQESSVRHTENSNATGWCSSAATTTDGFFFSHSTSKAAESGLWH